MREQAIKNAGGVDKLPKNFEDQLPPPPPPPMVDDLDIENLSMHLSTATIEAEIAADGLSSLDESGIERVPMADPGLEVRVRAS